MQARASLLLTLSALGLAGCGAEELGAPVEIPTSDLRTGLTLRGAVALTPDDHLVEALVHANHVYVANSWFGVGVMHLDDDGGLTITDIGEQDYGQLRCTTLALHPSSDTLYCAGDTPNSIEPRTPAIERFDLGDPGSPVQLEALTIEHWSVSDIDVVGDTLLIHQFDDGLWTAAIAADGSLSALQKLDIEGNSRTSVTLGEQVVAAFADPEGLGTELRLLDPEDWSTRASLQLAGPPLNISADPGGERVALGLGSAGMAIVRVGAEALELERTITPPAVVTQGLVEGELAVAVTLSGAFAYELGPNPDSEASEPRLFGFAPEGSAGPRRNGNMLHGVLHEGELIASDWTWVERWAIDPEGVVLDLDVPRGVYATLEGPVRFGLRNPGAQTLRAELWHGREHLLEVELAGHEERVIEISPEQRAALGLDVPTVTLGLRVHDPEVPREGEPVSTSSFVIAQRRPQDPLPPAVSDSFPILPFADRELAPFDLPLAGGTFAVWFTLDCALMWPEVEDIAWLERSGGGLGRGTPVILTDTDLVLDGFARRRSLEGLELGLWGPQAPAEVQEAHAPFGDPLYESFFVPDLPGDAVIMDYELDAEGRVRSIERMYRGPYTLADPGPW